MALVVKDRVKETSTSTGTGGFTLAGAVAGFQSFATALSNGDTTYYAITDVGTGDFEVGLGTYNSGVLTRTTILESSNADLAVNFQPGAKEVFITYPAEKAVYLDASGNIAPTTALMNTVKANDGTGSGVDADLLDGLHGSDFVLKAGDTISGDLTITGDLTVSGTTVTINATELAIEDNMVYMNQGSTVSNPDLGWAGNYNDGTYAHAGFFRDATDGRFKAYDGYTPEPDDSPYIDTTHASFSLADIEANTFYGALSGNASTASKWAAARTITLGGDLTGNVSLDGSANVTLTASVLDDSHNHIISNIDGLQTALDAKADDSTTISAGTGLTGGGTIGVNRTLSLDTTYTDGRYVNASGDSMTGNLSFGDNDKAIFGAGSDLQIYHDGSNGRSYIVESGSSNLYIAGENLRMTNTAGNEFYILADAGGAVSLRYDNVTKLATTSTGVDVTGNITVSGTVDGRDVANDGSKLDGIEAGATADQTAAEIKTAYESNANTNAYTDAEKSKLGGIEAGATADQTITAGSGLTGGGTGNVTLSHADTSAQASMNNSGGTVIQDVTLDTYGHVTGLGTINLDTRYYTESEADSRFVNATGDTMTGQLIIDHNTSTMLVLQATNSSPWAIDLGRDDVTNSKVYNGGGYWAFEHEPRFYNGGSHQKLFHDGYHPNADKLTTARNIALTGAVTGNANFDGSGNISIATTATADPTLTINGDASGSATFTNLGNATLTLTVANDSHTHDGRYYTESEADSRFVNVAGDTVAGDLSFNSGANIHRNTHSSGFLVGSYNSVGDNSNKTNPIYTIGSNYQPTDADLVNMYGIGYSHGNASFDGINSVLNGWGLYVAADGDARIGLDAQNGIIKCTGAAYVNTNQRVFADNYHPNADKLTTARNIALTGAVTGNANFDGSGNISISTTATSDPTLTINGDASGSATFTNLGNATLTLTIADDSHNHVISNVDGLQTALDGKASTSHNHTYNVNDSWLRDNGDNANVKLYGNSRQMAFRTDGTTEYATGVGGYPFAWMYGGDASGNRIMLLNSSGDLWTSTNGWLSSALAGKLSTSGKAADSNLLDGLDLHTGRNNEANKVVRTDSSGYIQAGWINTTSGSTTNNLDRIYASYDGYIRYVTPATFRSKITDGYYYPASNPNGYTSNVGDITGVTAGSGLTGGGTSGTVTVSHADTSSQGSVNNSGRVYIQDITLDTYGHITGITSTTVSNPSALSTASGSAPSYSARAWVNFNGVGTVSIRASGNISSITDIGVGRYNLNFSTALPDANYSVGCSNPTATDGTRGGVGIDGGYNSNAVLKTSSAVRLRCSTTTQFLNVVDFYQIDANILR
jgi:hypothetical protein